MAHLFTSMRDYFFSSCIPAYSRGRSCCVTRGSGAPKYVVSIISIYWSILVSICPYPQVFGNVTLSVICPNNDFRFKYRTQQCGYTGAILAIHESILLTIFAVLFPPARLLHLSPDLLVPCPASWFHYRHAAAPSHLGLILVPLSALLGC
jgi:hypothetical protein